MRSFPTILLLMASLVSWPGLTAGQSTPLSPRHKAWLEDEVAYIITPVERDVFKRLETDADRDSLIEEFWRQRDPTPGTARNEFKDEHDRRLEFADKTFSRGVPFRGRKTERGRIYITLGPPVDVQRYQPIDAHAMELWMYQGNPAFGQAPLFRILFYQSGGGGDFVIYNPVANSPKDLVGNPRMVKKDSKYPEDWDEWDMGAYLVLQDRMLLDVIDATWTSIPGQPGKLNRNQSSILLAEVQSYPQKKVKADYALAILEHRPVVEVSYSVRFMGNRTAMAVLEDAAGTAFLNYVLVPESVSLDRFGDRYLADLRTTLRLSDAAGATVYQQEKSIPIDLLPEELKRLREGSFQLYDAVPVVPGKWTLSILLENLVSKEFTTVEKTIEVPAPGRPAMSPLILSRKVFREAPAEDAARAFQVGRVQIYPSVNNVFPEKQKLFAFLQLRGLTAELRERGALAFTLTGDGRALWTARKALGDYPDPLAVVEEIPTEKLAAATYALRAAVVDAAGREILASQADVRLTADPVPSLWVTAQPLPPAGDPAVDLAIGVQLLKTGRAADALARLAKAASVAPGSVEILNALGECHAGLGEKDKALAAWTKSLEIMPNQEAIKARILSLR
jgi:GWxTD domain-containing protein